MWKNQRKNRLKRLQQKNLQKSLGNRGENEALEYLQRSKGFKFLDRNYRTRWGEIDLLMESPDKTIVFVEVKSRIKSKFGSPLEQVDSKKIFRFRRAVDYYLNERNWQDKKVRIDAIGLEYEIEGELEEWELSLVSIDYIEDITGW